MYHIKNDKRSKRSAETIYHALRSLIREKPFEMILVRDIVERAEIGRSTFYRNFDEIVDVLRMRCDQVLDELMVYVTTYHQKAYSQENGAMLKPILRYFYLDSEIIELLMQANRIDIFQDAFRERSRPNQAQLAQKNQVPIKHIAYVAEIRINILIAILTQWIKTGKREAPDELADSLKVIIYDLIPSIVQLL